MTIGQKPFHESLIDMIGSAESGDAPLVLTLIERTKIPAGHSEIIKAIRAKSWTVGYFCNQAERVIAELETHLEAHAREASTPAGSATKPDEIPETLENRKARVLMIIINKMIARYQGHSPDNLDERIFELHNIAKSVSWAKDTTELQQAITSL